MYGKTYSETVSYTHLGSVVAPSFGAPFGVSGKQSALKEAMDHFGVTENDLQKVMSAALEKGGDYVDLFFEHTFSNYVGLQDVYKRQPIKRFAVSAISSPVSNRFFIHFSKGWASVFGT